MVKLQRCIHEKFTPDKCGCENRHLTFNFHFLLPPFPPPPRDFPPESPNSWHSTLPRSSGSVSAGVVEDGVVTVGDAEVKLRKSKRKKKRSSMIFISEERERINTMDCKRVSELQWEADPEG